MAQRIKLRKGVENRSVPWDRVSGPIGERREWAGSGSFNVSEPPNAREGGLGCHKRVLRG